MWFHKKDKFPYKEGFKQASGVAGYVLVFSQLMVNGEQLFPHINKTWGPMMFLLLFCFSVLACGLMVFYRPYMLFMDKKGKEAAQLVLATAKWLGVYAITLVMIVFLVSRG